MRSSPFSAQRRGVVRTDDLEKIGASRTLLAYLAKKGVLRPRCPRAYVLTEHIPEHETFPDRRRRSRWCVLSCFLRWTI